MPPIGGWQMHVHHLDAGEFLQHRAWRESRSQGAQPLLECRLQAVGNESNEDVRLDAVVLLVMDRTDRQVILEFLERSVSMTLRHQGAFI